MAKKGRFFAREETFEKLNTFAAGESQGFEGGGTPSSKIFFILRHTGFRKIEFENSLGAFIKYN